MKTKKRKGNLLLTSLAFLFITATIGLLLSISIEQRENMRKRTEISGTAEIFVSMAAVCADGFKADVEAQTVTVFANVFNPQGNWGDVQYREALNRIQHSLAFYTKADGSWIYRKISDPMACLSYAEISDPAVYELLDKTMSGAEVEIFVHTPFSVSPGLEENEASACLNEVKYQVTITKGTWKIDQTYSLTGEKLIKEPAYGGTTLTIDGQNARNKMTHQRITRANIQAAGEE